jgi:hypothetical protein
VLQAQCCFDREAEAGVVSEVVAARDTDEGFAVLRLDDFFEDPLSSINVEDRITIQRVWPTRDEADSEAARLNTLVREQGQRRIRYFVQYARVIAKPASGRSSPDD